MQEQLTNLIDDYVAAAKRLFPRVASHLNIQLPISNIEWSLSSVEEVGETPNGIKYWKHGFGLKMSDSRTIIDLDLGPRGEYDGFDAMRLSYFVNANNIQTSYKTHDEIEVALQEALKAKELTASWDLYFLPAGEKGLWSRLTNILNGR